MEDSEIKAEQKCEILGITYSNLYKMNHYLRNRMYRTVTLAVGFFLVADGWFIGKESPIEYRAKILVAIAMTLVLGIALYSLYEHYREYLRNAAMIVRIEKAFGFYRQGTYLPSETLYELKSQEWGTGRYSVHIMRAYAIALVLLTAFSIFLILFL